MAEYNKSGKAASPARGQLNRENVFFPLSPFAPGNLIPGETGSAVPSRVSSLILPTQAESSIINYQSSIINLVLTCGISSAFLDGVIVHFFTSLAPSGQPS